MSSIQTIKRNEFIDHLFELDFDTKVLNILTLSDYLIKNGFFEQDELQSLVEYLKELIKIGFLEVNIGIDGLDPMWIEKSIILFENLNSEIAFNCKITIDFLKEIHALMDSFKLSSSQDKSIGLDKLAKVLNSYLKDISKEVLSFLKNDEDQSNMANVKEFHKPNILKIDTKIKNELLLNESYVKSVVKKLDKLTGLMAHFDYFVKDREAIKNVFLKLYSPNEKISFLRFYTDFNQRYKLPMEKIKKGKEVDIKPLILILTSMNLYDFSQDENIEAGIKTEYTILGNLTSKLITGETNLEKDAWEYFNKVIDHSELLFKNTPIYESAML